MLHSRYWVIGFLLLVSLALSAEVQERVVLQNGNQFSGTVVFENEEVLILRSPDGMRYQVRVAEIVSRGEVEEQVEEETLVAERKVSVMLQLTAGAAVVNNTCGVSESVDISIGANNVLQRHIFWGGKIGLHAYQWNGKNDYLYLPIAMTAHFPLMQQKHAPYLGASVGYGIGLRKGMKGGLYADMTLGWRCALNEQTTLFLGAQAAFQQAELPTTAVFDETSYAYAATNSFTTIGLTFAVQF